MFEIFKAELNNGLAQELISLSKIWESEKCCYGYVANSIASFKDKDIFIVKDDKRIIGYLLCYQYVKEEDSCTIKKGSRCLEIDEIYVLPSYRSQGLGQRLFTKAIDSYGNALEYVTLVTASKNYKDILRFYIEELDMSFWCASLFKKIN